MVNHKNKQTNNIILFVCFSLSEIYLNENQQEHFNIECNSRLDFKKFVYEKIAKGSVFSTVK